MIKANNVPRLRFPGFTDAWEQRKFKSTVQIERGGSPDPLKNILQILKME